MDRRRRHAPASGQRRGGQARPGAGPPAGRPARSGAVLRPRVPAVQPATTGRRTSLTGRAAVLAVVVCALALTLAYPLRSYLEQRAEISSLRDEVSAQEQRVEDLAQESERWNDPAFIKAQARERLGYVMPGETQYIVLEPDEAPAPGVPAPEKKEPAEGAWFTELWRSVEDAAASTDPAAATGR